MFEVLMLAVLAQIPCTQAKCLMSTVGATTP